VANDPVLLTLDCADLDPDRLHAISGDLARSLRAEGIAEATLHREEGAPGQKGDAVTIGTIVLTLIQTGGVAVTLLQVLKAYLARKSTLRFELARADGRKVSLETESFDNKQIESTRKLLADFLKD
jgi:hypothetical protein